MDRATWTKINEQRYMVTIGQRYMDRDRLTDKDRQTDTVIFIYTDRNDKLTEIDILTEIYRRTEIDKRTEID